MRQLAWLVALSFACALVPPVAAAPANDLMRHATVIGSLPFADPIGYLTDARREPGETGPCLVPQDSGAARTYEDTVWYKWTADRVGRIRAQWEQPYYPSFYGYVVVYVQVSGRLVPLGDCHEGLVQGFEFDAVPGTVYYIQLSGGYGSMVFRVYERGHPSNDAVAAAQQVPTGMAFAYGDNLGASVESGENLVACASVPTVATVWYRWVPGAGDHKISLWSGSRLMLEVYRQGSDGLHFVACDDPSPLSGAPVRFTADSGTYFIQVAAKGAAMEPFRLAFDW